MTSKTLEERVTDLERQLADLRQVVSNDRTVKDWQRTVGMFSGDEIMKRIDDEALKFRERDRRKAVMKRTKAKKTRA